MKTQNIEMENLMKLEIQIHWMGSQVDDLKLSIMVAFFEIKTVRYTKKRRRKGKIEIDWVPFFARRFLFSFAFHTRPSAYTMKDAFSRA